LFLTEICGPAEASLGHISSPRHPLTESYSSCTIEAVNSQIFFANKILVLVYATARQVDDHDFEMHAWPCTYLFDAHALFDVYIASFLPFAWIICCACLEQYTLQSSSRYKQSLYESVLYRPQNVPCVRSLCT
jgi:hypothetical protein